MNTRSKGQRSIRRVTKCITSRRDSRAAPSCCGCVVAQRDGPARLSRRATIQPRRTVILKAIEWSASVMYSIECPASSCFYDVLPRWFCGRLLEGQGWKGTSAVASLFLTRGLLLHSIVRTATLARSIRECVCVCVSVYKLGFQVFNSLMNDPGWYW